MQLMGKFLQKPNSQCMFCVSTQSDALLPFHPLNSHLTTVEVRNVIATHKKMQIIFYVVSRLQHWHSNPHTLITSGLIKSATRHTGFVSCFSNRSWKKQNSLKQHSHLTQQLVLLEKTNTFPEETKKWLSFLPSIYNTPFITTTRKDA